jgi:hypothetical protein
MYKCQLAALFAMLSISKKYVSIMPAKKSKQPVNGHDGPSVKSGDLPMSQQERKRHFTSPTFRH